ncbi:MAG: hypothetical protein RL618_1492 [Pseudomonadota bacterium]
MIAPLPRTPIYSVLLLAFAPLLGHAQSQEMGRVISSTPVVTQVAAPQQVCNQGQVITAAPKSGAGALIGAIAGGAIGSQIGGGSGRALATAVGVIGGAIAGDSAESAPAPVYQTVNHCMQQLAYENRITAYNVVYEYAGKQYSIQLPNDPGPYVPLRITPAVVAAPAAVVSPPSVSSTVISQPVVVTSAYPVAYPPVYYAPPVYYGQPNISFQWGYGGGWGGHHHRRYHPWR